MTHPGEQFYPRGVHWDAPIARGTLPDLLSTAATEHGARTVIEFRDRPISYAELEALVEDLRHCSMPYTCPHGRPTLIEMNFRELEKKFGRSQ